MSKSDYEILGLPENSDKEQVKQKYDMLIKSYKYKTDEYGTTNEDLSYYNEISEAYDRIMGVTRDYSDPNPTSIIPYKIRKVWYKIDAKIDSYKMLILGSVLVTIMVAIIVYQVVVTNDYDLKVKFVGAFDTLNTVQVCDNIEDSLGTDKELEASFFTVIEDVTVMDTQAKNSAVQFRSQVMSGAIDVIFIDVENMDVYIDDFMFLNLNDYIDELKADPNTAPLVENLEYYTYENKGDDDRLAGGVYGIYITDKTLFKSEESGLIWGYEEERQTMIAAICRTSENIEESKELITEILSKE
ncbi:MAG: hypothetical protein E7385_02505 [Ruminococcaceae bacterium]|nr:hypothetical protein [Oscillospiraceae bacterium]